MGESHPCSKVTEADVLNMFRLSDAGWNGTEISAEYGLNRNHVNRILAGKAWRHVRRST
jgi:hypothetical protein